MPSIIQTRILPENLFHYEEFQNYICKITEIPKEEIQKINLISRSIDARQRTIYYQISCEVFTKGEIILENKHSLPICPNVSYAEEVIIVGTGPAGLFSALECIQNGYKPVLIERGKNVKLRIEDIRDINLRQTVHSDSNYSFGEGGSGTYSDGKLYTRSNKRGDVRKFYELLVSFGADPEILIDSHPHIGTNRLPKIIKNIREFILTHGGEFHFETRVTDFILEGNPSNSQASIKGVITQKVISSNKLSTDKNVFRSDHVILATGHSAREIFTLLYNKGIHIEPKPIAIGVRVEHSQELIDNIQYKTRNRGNYLPPAPYSIVKQIHGRGVYSFCMCPGGVIAPCATAPDEIVTNGWSSSGRGRNSANSGIVVELSLDDMSTLLFDNKRQKIIEPLRIMQFQRSIEHKAWLMSGKTQRAPAQRLIDFTKGKVSPNLPKTSYPPGITNLNLKELLPRVIYKSLSMGLVEFNKSMKGYLTNDAVVHAPETRTSSPVRIPRNQKTFQHPQVAGLYPCGEGAGYAGGIASAALDGIRVGRSIKSQV